MRNAKGFTLIELLVVVAISAMLAAIAVVYTGVAKNEVALSVQGAQVAGFIFRAKELTLATYAIPAPPGAPRICGYGASFSIANNDYSIFAYEPDPAVYGQPGGTIPLDAYGELTHCPTIASTTAQGIDPANEMAEAVASAWNVPLTDGVKLVSGNAGDDLAVILFIPPDPATLIARAAAPSTFLDPNTTINLVSKVYLESAANGAMAAVTVNGAGEVNF